MSDTVQIKRGLKEHLPTEVLDGELLLCTDTKELYVGINGGAESVAMELEILIDSEFPVPQAIGGIKAGEVFNNVPLLDVFKKLLYPYAPPLIHLAVNQPLVNERGVSLQGVECVIKLTRKMHQLDTVKLLKNQVILNTWHDLQAGFTTPLTLIYTDSASLVTDVSYTVEVIDKEQTTHCLLPIHFELPCYVGICSEAIPSSATLNGATKTVKTKSNFYHAFTTNNQRMMLVYPFEWGKLSAAKDMNQFEILNTFDYHVINHQTLAGVNQYHAYVSRLTTLNNYRISFSF